MGSFSRHRVKTYPAGETDLKWFYRKFRDEYLNEHWFKDLNQAREIISEWRQDYNERRPHSTLNYLTTLKFSANYCSGKNDTTPNNVTS